MNVVTSPTPGTNVRYGPVAAPMPFEAPETLPAAPRKKRGLFATIAMRMRLNPFARHQDPEPEPDEQRLPAPARVMHGKTFPADEIVWGIVVRNGFDELDDPLYHRGVTQHAYIEGHDDVAICGFRPPQSGPRTRRRARLGLPTSGQHPMCGICARMVVAPRPRVPVPVQAGRPPVAIPVQPGHERQPSPLPRTQPVPQLVATAPTPVAPFIGPSQATTSPWVRDRTGSGQRHEEGTVIDLAARHDGGLLQRGVHSDIED